MHVNPLVLLAIPTVLSVAHFVGFTGGARVKGHLSVIRSFAAGFSVSYVFLFLLPEIPRADEVAVVDTAIFALLGFTVFHEAHKFIFSQKSEGKAKLNDEIHLITFSAYSFLITFFLVELSKVDTIEGIVVSLVIALHFFLTDITQARVSEPVKHNLKMPLAIVATLTGGMLSVFSLTNQAATDVIFALTTGALVYISIREEIPEKGGRPLVFLAGVLILTLVRAFIL